MSELTKNSIHTVTGTGYTSDGLGIARVDGRVVFVRGLLRGETAEIRILKASKSAVYAKIERLISPSAHRVTPDCPVYGRCGGCSLRHMDYAEELTFKLARVNDAFSRIGGLALTADEIIGSDHIDGYRNKTIYTVGMADGKAVTGFYRARSHELIPAPACAIESDFAKRAAAALRASMDEYRIPAFDEKTGTGIRRLMCRFGFQSHEGQIVLVTGRGGIPHEKALIEALLAACPETVSLMRNTNPNPGDTILSRDFAVLWGADHITDELCSLRFHLAADAFYQVNRDQAEKLYGKALEYAGLTENDTALDLYCGTGTITLCLARQAKRVVGAEIVESAIENARANAVANGIENADFICADAGEAAKRLEREGFRPDVVVVDPPRKGLFPEVPGIIASMAPKRVVYVSCDPATLARDLKLFSGLGYTAVKATVFDLFPRTASVETAVKLVKGA